MPSWCQNNHAFFTNDEGKFTGKEFSTLEELQSYFANLFVHEDNTTACVYEFSC